MLIGAVLFIIYAMRTPWEMATPLVFAFFVFVFAFQGGVISRLLLTRPVQWLGEHSYTIYMVHAFIITNAVLRPLQLVQKLFKVSIPETPSVYGEMPRFIMPGGEIGAVVVILTYTAMVLLAAALTFRFVEKPAQKALIRLLAARKQAAHSK
jgi:peptidoglycan/LPS O-acetylase OafA/YrhL